MIPLCLNCRSMAGINDSFAPIGGRVSALIGCDRLILTILIDGSKAILDKKLYYWSTFFETLSCLFSITLFHIMRIVDGVRVNM